MIEEQRLEGQFNLLLEYVIIIQRILEDIQSNEIDVNSLRDIRLSTSYFVQGDGEISLSQNTPNVRYGRLLVSTPPYIGLIESSKCTEYENNVSQVYN